MINSDRELGRPVVLPVEHLSCQRAMPTLIMGATRHDFAFSLPFKREINPLFMISVLILTFTQIFHSFL